MNPIPMTSGPGAWCLRNILQTGRGWRVWVAVALALAAWGRGEAEGARRVYSRLLDPREHPDYDRRAVQPPSWDTFGNQTRFTTLRGFRVENGRIVDFVPELEKFTRTHDLGEVVWPSYPILFAENLGELAAEIKRRNLYLFDVWGYVPGSGPGGYWQQFEPPAGVFPLLEGALGDRWLGTDIGEQDGRYVGGYANQLTPASAGRFEQYLNFQRHFERMGDALGHRHATLVSLNFGHYLLKEGTYTLIGAETAQALPNNQVYYAFIRGAGKQHGVPWFGNASIYNRWGYKVYGSSGRSDGYAYGPTSGSSLSLLKRLLYTHVLYNCVAVGFENMWLDGEALSPIGRIQQQAQRWVRAQGPPGVLHTPVALLVDVYSGWSFPRHLYTDRVFRVWGNLPYEPGDCLTDAVLDLLYPGYADASYFHDERGFIAPTPYGDIADCLLSDAPGWLLARYPVVVVAGVLSGGRELRDTLEAYVREGGHLVLPGAQLAAFPDGLAGQRDPARRGTSAWGAGRLTILAPDLGLEFQAEAARTLRSETDRPLARPYRLRPEVREALDAVFREQLLFTVGDPALSLVTCRRGPGAYTLGVANNGWRAVPLQITSRCGPIEQLRELALDQSEQEAVGYVPEGVDAAGLGRGGETSIAGGEVRLFAVQVRETNVVEIPHVRPAPRPRNRFLTLRPPLRSLKEEVLRRPTFFAHWDGVVVEGGYLRVREASALTGEAPWLRRQGLRIAVDLSGQINLYPGLRLLNNLASDYAASTNAIADVLGKMSILGARDLILTLHRHPENNFTDEASDQSFEATLRAVSAMAAARNVTVHLRLASGKPPWSVTEAVRLLDRVGAANLRLAPSTALLMRSEPGPDLPASWADRIGLWLVAAARTDWSGQVWDTHAPLQGVADARGVGRWLALAPGVPRVLDAILPDADAEYLETRALDHWSGLELESRARSDQK